MASEGTLAGRFVAENDIGWTIPYEQSAAVELISTLVSNPSIFLDKHVKLKEISAQHPWQSRAQQVIKDLTQ